MPCSDQLSCQAGQSQSTGLPLQAQAKCLQGCVDAEISEAQAGHVASLGFGNGNLWLLEAETDPPDGPVEGVSASRLEPDGDVVANGYRCGGGGATG